MQTYQPPTQLVRFMENYCNRSNFHGTNISRIPKMDSICDFIFTNPPLYNIHEFVFALMEFDGACMASSEFPLPWKGYYSSYY